MLSRLEDERREAEQNMATQRKKHEEEMRVYLRACRNLACMTPLHLRSPRLSSFLGLIPPHL